MCCIFSYNDKHLGFVSKHLIVRLTVVYILGALVFKYCSKDVTSLMHVVNVKKNTSHMCTCAYVMLIIGKN